MIYFNRGVHHTPPIQNRKEITDMTRTELLIDLYDYINILKEFKQSHQVTENCMRQIIRKESIEYNYPLSEQQIGWILYEIYQ